MHITNALAHAITINYLLVYPLLYFILNL